MGARNIEVMTPRELRYQGYRIRLFAGEDGWRVRARPLTPDKPILRYHSFLVSAASENEAVEHAKRLVDELLAQFTQ
jgi:hypothetical protein